MEIVTYVEKPSRIGLLRVAATPKGVCKIALGNETLESLMVWLARHLHPDAILEEGAPATGRAVEQIDEYLKGQRRAFKLRLDIRGSEFQRAVWAAVAKIPYGQTRSYADLAAAIGRPSAVRAVGAAVAANPLPLVIPCHRVIGRDGSLTGYGGGLEVKQFLLDLERA